LLYQRGQTGDENEGGGALAGSIAPSFDQGLTLVGGKYGILHWVGVQFVHFYVLKLIFVDSSRANVVQFAADLRLFKVTELLFVHRGVSFSTLILRSCSGLCRRWSGFLYGPDTAVLSHPANSVRALMGDGGIW